MRKEYRLYKLHDGNYKINNTQAIICGDRLREFFNVENLKELHVVISDKPFEESYFAIIVIRGCIPYIAIEESGSNKLSFFMLYLPGPVFEILNEDLFTEAFYVGVYGYES